jgi:hypothetical protein
MRSQIYLVLIRDGRLALTVGAALEDRLLRDGYRAMALVPAVRGPEFADSDCRRHLATWRSGSEPVSHAPQVVALYEDGILADLASLGLPAYVGVRHSEEPQIARWTDDSGAIMLPVTTARDLVDAVADHTPWSRYAADLPSAPYPVVRAKATPMVRRSRQSGHGRSSVRPHKIATVASVAGPLLLAGLPPAAIAASGPSRAPTLATAASGGSVIAVNTADVQPSSPPSTAANNTAAANNTSTPSNWSNWVSQLSNAYVNAMAQSAQAQINEAQANQAFANSVAGNVSNAASNVGTFFGQLGNAYANAAAQSAQAQITAAQANIAFWNAVAQAAPQAYQAGTATGNQAMLPGAAIGGPIVAGIAAAGASETGPGALVAAAGGYPVGAKIGAVTGYGVGFSYGFLKDLYNSLNTSPAGGSTAQTGATGSTPGGNTGGGFTSPIGQAVASGDQLGQAIGGPAARFAGMAGAGYGFFQPADGAFSTLKNTAGSLGNFGATAGGLGYTAGFGIGFLKSLLGSPPGTPSSGIAGKTSGLSGDPSAGTPDGTQAGNGAPAGDSAPQAPQTPGADGAPAAPATDAAPAAPAAPATDAAPAAPAAPATDAAPAAPAAPATDAAPAAPAAASTDAPLQAPAVPAPPVVVPPPVTSSVSGNTAVAATAPTTITPPTTTSVAPITGNAPAASVGGTTSVVTADAGVTTGAVGGASAGGGASG